MSQQQKKKSMTTTQEEKTPSPTDNLQIAIAAIQKQFGKEAISQSKSAVLGVEFFSSGSISLDCILGGGWSRGRMVELYGPESSGKTTIALHAIAEIQKLGEVAAFIDAEHAFDPAYAEALGVDMGKLLFSQPDSGEQALEITETLVRSGAVKLIVIDSVAALVPQREIEGEMGDSSMGRHAMLMSQAMRKLAGICSKSGCTIIFINQIRIKIGLVFGNPETVTGGNALKFYASQRLEVRRAKPIKDGKDEEAEIVGNETNCKVVKNKVAPPFRKCELVIRYGQGIDTTLDLLKLAVTKNVIAKSGAWYNFGETRLGQGEDSVREKLLAEPKLKAQIEKALRDVLQF